MSYVLLEFVAVEGSVLGRFFLLGGTYRVKTGET
jgi:hypothetical protein